MRVQQQLQSTNKFALNRSHIPSREIPHALDKIGGQLDVDGNGVLGRSSRHSNNSSIIQPSLLTARTSRLQCPKGILSGYSHWTGRSPKVFYHPEGQPARVARSQGAPRSGEPD